MNMNIRMLSLCYVNVTCALYSSVFSLLWGIFIGLRSNFTTWSRRYQGRCLGRRGLYTAMEFQMADFVLYRRVAREQRKQLFTTGQAGDRSDRCKPALPVQRALEPGRVFKL